MRIYNRSALKLMDLSSLVDISWHQFDRILKDDACDERSFLVPTGDVEPHVCGMDCPHVIMDDSGGYVCRLTGLCFGQQLCNGPTDRRICDTTVTPSPTGPKKRRRSPGWMTSNEEVFSACVQMVKKLLSNATKTQSDAARLGKALKSAVRLANAEHKSCVCALDLMYMCFSEIERCGAIVVKREITAESIDFIARLLFQLYHTVIAPYALVEKHRPTSSYYAAAMCYQLAAGTLGEKLHVPILSASLPEEKSLKNFGIIVSRVTTAKRYILAAIKKYVENHPKPEE